MMQGLDLDDEQQTRMRERRSEHRHQQFSRMAEMMDLREEMHALMRAERPDRGCGAGTPRPNGRNSRRHDGRSHPPAERHTGHAYQRTAPAHA